MRRFALIMPSLLLLIVASARLEAADRLNVLFLMSDDLRPDLRCYGNAHVKSPSIDALAAAGVLFERAYVQFPLCNPSRTSLLTGRYPTQTGVMDNRAWFGAAHPDFVSLPRQFKENGYVTLRSGKIFHGGIDDTDAWTEGGEKRNFEGAQRPDGPRPNYAQTSDREVRLQGDGESHGDYKAADRAIEMLRAHKDEPFFLACGFSKPHSPPTAPGKYFDMYDPATVPLPVDFQPRPTVPEGFPKASVPSRNSDLFIGRDASREAAQEMIRAYWASSTWMDWNLGRVTAELDRLGLRDKTVIVFWGDHGYHLGEKGKWSKHGSLFEVGTRVPLIIVAPGAKGNGQTCPRIVETVDLYPTLLDLCGLPHPTGLEGDSLVPLLADPQAEWDKPAFSVSGNNNRLAGVAVRTERYRYVEYDGPNGGAMLFDENTDPDETKNMVEEPRLAEVRMELMAKMRQFRNNEIAQNSSSHTRGGNAKPDSTPIELIEAVRQRPWDEKTVLALADWFDRHDPPRGELARVQMQISQMSYRDPRMSEAQEREQRLLEAHHDRWTAPLAALGTSRHETRLDVGLIDSVTAVEVTDEQIGCLRGVPELRQLTLRSPKLSSAGYEIISALRELDALTIEDAKITPQVLACFERLPPWTSIRLFADNLDRQAFNEMNTRRVAKFDQLTPEEQHSAGVRFLSTFDYGLKYGRPLTGAGLAQSGITDLEMRLLSRLPELESVSITESDVTTAGIAHLVALTNLTHLSLEQTRVDSINALAGLTKLKSLSLFAGFDTPLGDAGVAVLERFVQLEKLYLNDESVGDATIRRLAPLTKMRELDLTIGNVDDEETLSVLAGMPQLQQLSLHAAGVSTASLSYLSRLSQLETLDLQIDRDSDDGFRQLARLNRLKYLFLSGDGVTDTGIEPLAVLRELRSIMAEKSAITRRGAERLAAQLPDVTIVLRDDVVKSPRMSYSMIRNRLDETTSVLLPEDWIDNPAPGRDKLFAREAGWERIWSWSSRNIGPTEIQIWLKKGEQTAQEAMLDSVDREAQRSAGLTERDVQAIMGVSDAASCIYGDDDDRYLVVAARTDAGVVMVECSAKAQRFDEFRSLFIAVARSLRVSADPARHAAEKVEWKVTDLPREPS